MQQYAGDYSKYMKQGGSSGGGYDKYMNQYAGDYSKYMSQGAGGSSAGGYEKYMQEYAGTYSQSANTTMMLQQGARGNISDKDMNDTWKEKYASKYMPHI